MNRQLNITDRGTITRARELAAMGTDEIRAAYGDDHHGAAFAYALGRAQVLLADLAQLAERLTERT